MNEHDRDKPNWTSIAREPLADADFLTERPAVIEHGFTVAELIAELGRFPPDARVVVPHFYDGFTDLGGVYAQPIRHAADADASMAHAPYKGGDPMDDGPFVADETAVVLDVGNKAADGPR